MRQFIAILASLTLAFPVQAADTVFQNDVLKTGRKTTNTDKKIVFQSATGDSPTIETTPTVGDLRLTSKQVQIGNGEALDDQELIFDNGAMAKPAIKYNPATQKIEFSNDGIAYKGIGSGSGTGSGLNLLENPNAEDGTLNWTSGGVGIFEATEVAANVAEGTKSFSFDAANTGDFVRSDTYTVPGSLQGKACVAAFVYKGGDSNLEARVFDSLGGLLSSVTLSARTTFNSPDDPTYLGFNCPTSGGIYFEIFATAAAAPIFFDLVHLGSIVQTNLFYEVSQWVPYTPTFTGFGTPTNVEFAYRQIGDSIEVSGKFTAGTTTAVTASMTLPSGFLTPVFVTGIRAIGEYFYGVTSVSHGGSILANSNSNLLNFGDVGIFGANNVNALSPAIATNVSANGGILSVKFTVPIQNLSRTTADSVKAVRIGTDAWKVDANITGANPSLGGAAVLVVSSISNPNLTLVNNPGLGNIPAQIPCSGANPSTGLTCAVGDETLGVAFNLPEGHTEYIACASFSHNINNNSNGNVNALFRIFETANNSQTLIQSGKTVNPSTILNGAATLQIRKPIRLCGNFSATTAGLKTLRLGYTQDATVANNENTIISDGVGERSVHWEVYPLNVGKPNPIILNSVSTPNVAGERVIRARIVGTTENTTCTVSPCTILRQSGGLASVTRINSGIYDFNFDPGTFSANPSCTYHAGNGVDVIVATDFDPITTLNTRRVRTYVSNNAGGADARIDVICIGPR